MSRWIMIAGSVLGLALSAAADQFVLVPGAAPFVLRNAATPEKRQIETMPGGVAVFDADNDGRLDLYFVNGAPQPGLRKTGPEWWNRLYLNRGGWRFEDATERSGLKGEGYGMGAAAGDYDNDGALDLLVTGVGFATLYRNRGEGVFEDVTARAGIPQTPWPISAGWFDADNDGRLDLWIVNYCRWDPKTEPFCGDARAGYRTYCHPKYYEPLPSVLLRNNGDGTFRDVSASAGISSHLGKGMGVAFADADGDGRVDVFVTNDTTPNFLFRNLGDWRFEEIGLAAGIAFTDDGKAVSSMGLDVRDIDNDGLPDLFLTALTNETFPLYRNLGQSLFQEMTQRARLATGSIAYSGWSNGVADFDNDGWKDIFTANGDVQDNTEVYSSRSSRQRNQFYRNRGDGTFEPIAFGAAAQHRGVAFGDLDGDGRLDAVVTQLNGEAIVLRNNLGEGRNWLGFRLRGAASNRDALGAKVKIVAGGRAQWNHASRSVGYLCSSDAAVHFGLGEADRVERVEIEWPSGRRQVLTGVPANRYLSVSEP